MTLAGLVGVSAWDQRRPPIPCRRVGTRHPEDSHRHDRPVLVQLELLDELRQRAGRRVPLGQRQHLELGLRMAGTLLIQPRGKQFRFHRRRRRRQHQGVVAGTERTLVGSRRGHDRPLGRGVLGWALAALRGAALGWVALAVFFAAAFFAAAFAGVALAVLAGVALAVLVALRGTFRGSAFFRYTSWSGSSSTGPSGSVSIYSWRTSAIRSASVSTVQLATEIGGNTATSTVPGFMVVELRAAMISALGVTNGTTGIPTAIAMRNGPFLNGPTLVVSSLVPSGAIMMDRPCLARSSTWCSDSTAAAGSSRSMKTESSPLPTCPMVGR